jgi:hypothetical protein
MARFPSKLTRLFATVLIFFVWRAAASSQTVAISEDGHSFYHLGIDINGTVIILGSADGENGTLYEFTGTGFRATPFPPLFDSRDPEGARLSRDGQCVVTSDHLGESVTPALWIPSQGNAFLYANLASLPDESDLRASDVANTPDGPLVVGTSFPTSIFWTLQDGLTPWITNNQPFLSVLTITRLSADGQTFAGRELLIRREGDPVLSRAISGTRTNFSYLQPRNSDNSEAMAISPNGRFISGYADLHPVLWHGGKVKRLLHNKHTVGLSDTVTDHGFAGLRTPAGPMIYDPRLRQAVLFPEWWAGRYPHVPLPPRILQITDLYEHGGSLYFLLRARNEELGTGFAVVAIVPIPDLPAKPNSWWADQAFDE